MSRYPMLDERPIDQWKVTELKDELERRKLPIKGLKDDLLRTLFEAIQGEALDGGEETSPVTSPVEELKGGETTGSGDASVYEALMEQNVDEGLSEVTNQGADPVTSVTEASNESLVANPDVSPEAVVTAEVSQEAVVGAEEVSQEAVVGAAEVSQEAVVSAAEVSQEAVVGTAEVTQEAVVGTTEVSQRTLGAVVEVEAPLVDVELAATDKNCCETNVVGLESARSGNTLVKEVHPHSGGDDGTIEKTPEDNLIVKMVVDDVPSDTTSINIKLGIDVDTKILEQEAVTTPSTIVLCADDRDADVVAAAEPGDDTSKKMAIDDVVSTSSDVRLGVNVDCKSEQEEVPTQPDDVVLHANVFATAESMIPENNLSENTLMHCKDHEDPKRTNGDCKPILRGPNDQVSEVNPDPGCKVKPVSVSHDNIPTNEKSNMNTDNSDLKLAVKLEMVKPPSSIPSTGDDLLGLDGKDLQKNGTTVQELQSTINIDLDRKEDSPDGSSLEKVNLDKSSDDESMDEDVMECKLAESNIKSDDGGGKTKVTSDHVLEELTLIDTVTKGSSTCTEEVVAEEKPPTPADKRKIEGQGVIANSEPNKRQRQWNVDTANIRDQDQQASKLTGTGTPEEVFRSVQQRSFGRSDTTASGDSRKERIVPPPKKSATTSLRIDQFVRPFTLKAVQELLGKTGSVYSFWMDHIKTHCYVTYSSVEEAVATRNAVYNLQWPPNNGSYLVAEFVDPREVKHKLELPPPCQVPISPITAPAPQAAPIQQSEAKQMTPLHAAATSRGLLPTPSLVKPSVTSEPGPERERLRPPKKLEPPLTLDDLFKKTQAYPRIYYVPLSQEEASAKLAVHGKGKRG